MKACVRCVGAQLVEILDLIWSVFDSLIDQHGVHKVRTRPSET